MPELLCYPTEELPDIWKWQILSFQRATWPEGFMGANLFRDWITKPEDHPVSFILVEREILIGHTNVVWKMLDHAGASFIAYGLTGVFAYPNFRHQGHGLRLVQAATDYIDTQAADIALFHCDPELVNFYQQAQWQAFPGVQTFVGPREEPIEVSEMLMLRFISAKGRQYRSSFEQGQLYFSSDSTW